MSRGSRFCWAVGASIGVLLSQGVCSIAQEPAQYHNTAAVRFEEAPGYYHYIQTCIQAKDDTYESLVEGEPALCWAVVAIRLQAVNGKLEDEGRSVIAGTLKVSKSLVSFIPGEPSAANPVKTFATTAVSFHHDIGQVVAFVGTPTLSYAFGLAAVCIRCVPGSLAIDPAKTAQLDAEYALIDNSIKDFDGSLKRHLELSSHMRFGVTPDNQPGPDATAESLKMWAALNGTLAGMCSEPAKSCVQMYAAYQSCRAGVKRDACGAAPTCSAFFALVPEVYRKLQADVRLSPMMSETSDYAWLSPRRPGDPPLPQGVIGMSAGVFNGGAVGARKDGAKPKEILMIKEDEPPPPVTAGVAGMGASMLSGASGPASKIAGPTHGGSPRIPAGVMQGLIVTRVNPVYPPIARAARISGTVTLHAIIGKEGRIERLEAISGPPMLQGAALDAVKHWTYKPFLLNGEPVEVDTTVIVNFNLTADPASVPPTQ
jgi:periplasmic protein TonB